jgi:hypothetical protein
MTACTLAAIVGVLGFTPARGAVVDVPAAVVAQHSRLEVAYAKACARRFGIHWRIVKE